jgi:hypothetical protein
VLKSLEGPADGPGRTEASNGGEVMKIALSVVAAVVILACVVFERREFL